MTSQDKNRKWNSATQDSTRQVLALHLLQHKIAQGKSCSALDAMHLSLVPLYDRELFRSSNVILDDEFPICLYTLVALLIFCLVFFVFSFDLVARFTLECRACFEWHDVYIPVPY
jgi:hypothetical protein